MKRVFLHIGMAKTGTTAIQRTLEENREALSALGFAYPGAARNHNQIVADFAAQSASLRAAIDAAGGDVIISSEGLSNLAPADVREWLAGLDVRVICYVRDQADAFASHYQQQVKAELETATFEEFCLRFGVVDYTPFLRAWANAFGRSNMIVRVYQSGVDVVPDFLAAVGLAADGFVRSDDDPNPSIAGDLLEAKRLINQSWRGTSRDLRALLHTTLHGLAKANPAWRGVQINALTARRIREAHRDCNQALVREWPETSGLVVNLDHKAL